jgi:hypothetical protein
LRSRGKIAEKKKRKKHIDFYICLTIGNIEWEDKSKRRCLVLWKSPEEWAKTIYQWVYCVIFLIKILLIIYVKRLRQKV